MLGRPLPHDSWIQALANEGAWRPPPEWAQDYGWLEQLPRPLPESSIIWQAQPEQVPRMREATPEQWNAPGLQSWTDVPDWLQALNMDRDYERSRVIESPYGGWGGGAMQARRRGLR